MSATEPAPQKSSSRRAIVQISLRTLLLLTAAVAVWVAHFKSRHDVTNYATKIAAMRPLARELFVDDPKQIAVVKQEERWYDQNDWKLYLPSGQYRLCLATEDVSESGLAPIHKSMPIASGTHDVAIEQKRTKVKDWGIVVTVDHEEVLRVEQPADWNAGHGSSGGGQFSLSKQLPPDEPVVLFRQRFMVPATPSGYSTPMGPCKGLLLWVEPQK